MQMAELIAYAKERYGIEEQHKWAEFPGFSVLCHPQTGKWIALLMRQWDAERGEEIERCDLKCGEESLLLERPFLTPPVRMRGSRWIGIAFDAGTESALVCSLLDRALAGETPHGFTFVLDARLPGCTEDYRETPLPFAPGGAGQAREAMPERLREMRRLYEYSRESPSARAGNFFRQAVLMEDYEDDLPWTGDFVCFFPTYHDMTARQLRGYFTWRARLRRGEVQPIPASAAYLYVYELLNGVGAATPEACLEKLRDFERRFLDSGIGDARMRPNLRRWMLEFAVLHGLPPELAREAADPELIARDAALSALRKPEAHTDEEIFAALLRFGGKKLESSPVLSLAPERGARLFAQCWRAASAFRRDGKDLFTLCFGSRVSRRWYPLSNAVVHERSRPADGEYVLDDCRSYLCRGGIWRTEGYEKLNFDRERLQGFLHEADAQLRRYLKTGRYLRQKAEEEWAVPWIDAVIEADRRAEREAARPRITIDLSGLEQIRRDAAATRESLLTEEETEEERPEAGAPAAPESGSAALPEERVEYAILRALLEGRDPAEILAAHHLTPSLAADAVNEALFDEIGDTVVLCEDERLLAVDDYLEDLQQILGGTEHGGA